MKADGYTKIGPTKALSITFTLFYPSSEYFVSVTMLFEFTSLGQVIPTRFDALPYRLSAFAPAQTGTIAFIDTLKYLMVIQTIYVIYDKLRKKGNVLNLVKWSTVQDNVIDIIIVLLQSYGFFLKI